jgi:hypothetical protein
MADKQENKPFKVITIGPNPGRLRSEHETIEQATYACAEANDWATTLKIETRYEVWNVPE